MASRRSEFLKIKQTKIILQFKHLETEQIVSDLIYCFVSSARRSAIRIRTRDPAAETYW